MDLNGEGEMTREILTLHTDLVWKLIMIIFSVKSEWFSVKELIVDQYFFLMNLDTTVRFILGRKFR